MHPVRPLSHALFVGSLSVFLSAACGSSSKGDGHESAKDGGVGNLEACANLGAGRCGAACTLDQDCGGGMYCAQSQCAADCTPTGPGCSGNLTCSSTGQCEDLGMAVIPPSEGGTSHEGGAQGDACADLNVGTEHLIPTVMVLVDQSGSMTDKFGSAGGNRWTVLHDALMDPSSGFIKKLEGQVRFGVTLYTSHNGSLKGETCPLLTSIAPALNNYAAIKTLYDTKAPDGDTPTGESIQKVAADLAKFPEPGPKYIVLATDGEPDTCAVPNPQNGQAETLKATQDAFAQQIRTIPIGVAREIGEKQLQAVANAGAGLPVDGTDKARFYQALDQNDLAAALLSITNEVRTCTFTLHGTVDLSKAGSGTVSLDGKSLGYNSADGWKLTSPTTLEITGSSCTTYKADASPSLTARFPCDTVQIVN